MFDGTMTFGAFIFSVVLTAACGALGVTAGAHRLWAHKAYKAKWPLRLILAIFQTMAFQVRLFDLLLYPYFLFQEFY